MRTSFWYAHFKENIIETLFEQTSLPIVEKIKQTSEHNQEDFYPPLQEGLVS